VDAEMFEVLVTSKCEGVKRGENDGGLMQVAVKVKVDGEHAGDDKGSVGCSCCVIMAGMNVGERVWR